MPITSLLIVSMSEGSRRDAITLGTTLGTKDLAPTPNTHLYKHERPPEGPPPACNDEKTGLREYRASGMGANALSLSSTALCNILLIVATMKMRMAHRLGLWCLGTFCGLQVERLL